MLEAGIRLRPAFTPREVLDATSLRRRACGRNTRGGSRLRLRTSLGLRAIRCVQVVDPDRCDLEKDGAVTTWTLSTLPTAMMRRAGLTKESPQGQPGEVVTINAIAARDETKKLGWISKITYADGHHVQLGRD